MPLSDINESEIPGGRNLADMSRDETANQSLLWRHSKFLTQLFKKSIFPDQCLTITLLQNRKIQICVSSTL